jgi:hypothetical protein
VRLKVEGMRSFTILLLLILLTAGCGGPEQRGSITGAWSHHHNDGWIYNITMYDDHVYYVEGRAGYQCWAYDSESDVLSLYDSDDTPGGSSSTAWKLDWVSTDVVELSSIQGDTMTLTRRSAEDTASSLSLGVVRAHMKNSGQITPCS